MPDRDAPPPSDQAPVDKWADWLLHGRQRGYDQLRAKRMLSGLAKVANRVLREAKLRKGRRLLDIGAGTGLVALAARRRAGPTGRVVALDVSHDALLECRRQATDDPGCAPLFCVVGDAAALPFRDGAFDAATTRSVLIYVADKLAAIGEMHRVLSAGGTAGVFEPINSAGPRRPEQDDGPPEGEDPDLWEQRRQVMEYFRAQESAELKPMVDFDERDLLRLFGEAGFETVKLTYEHTMAPPSLRERRPDAVVAQLRSRPNPLSLSYEEVARNLFGDGADEHLRRVAEAATSVSSRAGRRVGAVAYLAARKAR